jgi:2-amino-4-hydroxy-6-hydroxymethyldihydropteridine diphosphokinase|tara:strand:+ start:191 stop:715 length:525 start_codon:yes stop_codon:yes gene_type:complete
MTGERVVIGVGGNMGDPVATLSSALDELGKLAVGEIVVSNIYRSEPVGLGNDASDFANAVAQFECEFEPMMLLKRLQTLEQRFGRVRQTAGSRMDGSHAYESRTLDLDIISFGDRLIAEGDLQVPHPRAFERLFVLLPLQEIDPGFQFADRAESLQQLIDQAPEMAIRSWQHNQ